VLIENNTIIGRFQSLMNPGFRISSFIESYTGISNELVEAAPISMVDEIKDTFGINQVSFDLMKNYPG